MANKIKGLTVEIGGDTTKLGKALDGVNSKSKNLSGELGQINRLLKLDPGNTELLAQKQKVLAGAISNTKDKLDTLREAQKQVQKQFERGEVSEEQYRALSREIIQTENKLKSYEKAAKDVEKGNKGIAESADKAESSTGKLGEGLANAAKVGMAAVATAATAVLGALVGSAEASREYRVEMGKLNTAFTTNGFSAKAGAEAYGELIGIIGDVDQTVEATNHLAKLTDSEKELAMWTGDILPGVFATFGDSLQPEGLTEAANETAKVGQIVGPLADAINWATTENEKWNEALGEGSEAQKAFAAAAAEGMSAEDAFNAALATANTEQERSALITQTLASLYGEASGVYKEMNAEVIRANKANEEWRRVMADVGGAVEPLVSDVKFMGAAIVSDLLPGVKQLATAFRSLLDGDKGGASALGDALTGIITDLLNKVTELAPTLVQVGVSLITSLTTTLVSMLPQLVTVGISMITTILDGLTSAIPVLTQAIVDTVPKLVQALVSGLPQMLQGAVTLLMAVVQAIPQILPVIIEALPQIVVSIVTTLVSQIPTLLSGAVTLLMAIVRAIPQIIQALVPQIPTIVSAIVSALVQAAPVLLAGALQLLWEIIKAVPQIVVELAKVIPNIVGGIVKGLLDGVVEVGKAALEIGKSILDSIKNFFGIHSPSSVMKTIGGYIVDGMVNGVKVMPAKVLGAIKSTLTNVQNWGSDLVNKAKTAATNTVNNVFNIMRNIPGKVTSAISGVISYVASWGSNMAGKARAGMSQVVSVVTSGLSGLPSKVLSIGSNLVTGLWNGIGNKLSWLKNKISGFASSVLDSIKSFFGVHSPSTETEWVGDMLDQGLAKGVLANMADPVKAMQRVAKGVISAAADEDGLSIDGKVQTATVSLGANQAANVGLMAKLDRILTAIERGQVITIDRKTLVGATAGEYDNQLGQRRALAARGRYNGKKNYIRNIRHRPHRRLDVIGLEAKPPGAANQFCGCSRSKGRPSRPYSHLNGRRACLWASYLNRYA